MRVHAFTPDHANGPDHRGDYRCSGCGLPEGNQAHAVDERVRDEIREEEERRTGERSDVSGPGMARWGSAGQGKAALGMETNSGPGGPGR